MVISIEISPEDLELVRRALAALPHTHLAPTFSDAQLQTVAELEGCCASAIQDPKGVHGFSL